MKIINKLYKDWSAATRKRLRSLSLRSEGDMCKALAKRPCDTFVVFENGTIVGWAIYVLTPWYHSTLPGDFMIYIRKSQRNRGVARTLIKEGLKKYGTLRIHPWNRESGEFFSKMLKEINNLEIARGEGWIR